METIMQAARRIEREFDEPLDRVLSGFAKMGYSRPLLAEVLEVSEPSLRMFCHRREIHFSRSPAELCNNRGRPPRRVRHAGRELSISQWANELGVSVSTVHRRVSRRDWRG